MSPFVRRANGLIASLTWGPALAWVAWVLFDPRLGIAPWLAACAALAIALSWAHAARHGLSERLWPVLPGAGAILVVSYAVAARPGPIGAFLLASTLAWTVANGAAGALIAAWAARLPSVHSYAAVENLVLRSVMLCETALMAGVTSARFGQSVGGAIAGLAGGTLGGVIAGWFQFAAIYALMNTSLSLAERRRQRGRGGAAARR